MSTRKPTPRQQAAAARARARDDRDHQIYNMLRQGCTTQAQAARVFNLTQARISQIMDAMSRRMAAAAPPISNELAAIRAQQDEAAQCQERQRRYLAQMERDYEDSIKPLTTTKTRYRNNEIEYQDVTVKEQKRSNITMRTMLKTNREIEARAAQLPPPPPEQVLAQARQSEKAARRKARAERARLTRQTAEDRETTAKIAREAAEARARQEQAAAAKAAAEERMRFNASPQGRGQREADDRLFEVILGALSLADAETKNKLSGEAHGAEHPSYYEICDENINGVRVAGWVSERVPHDRLPQGDDVWLPVSHCLKDWNPEGRNIEPNETRVYIGGQRQGYHFGALVGSAGPAEPDGRGEVAECEDVRVRECESATARECEGAAGREAAGERSHAKRGSEEYSHTPTPSHSPTPTPPLAERQAAALAELRRVFGWEIWPEMADATVPRILGEGHLLLRGYRRPQREALHAWQRLMAERS